MVTKDYQIRMATAEEYGAIGQLMVQVYSQLDGFPKPEEQPAYYHKLANIGEMAETPRVDLLVAVNDADKIGGTVVYFHDITQYGAQGIADREEKAGGFKLPVLDHAKRGQELGIKLTLACLGLASKTGKKQVVIHSTKAMQVAWSIYKKLGFVKAKALDFD